MLGKSSIQKQQISSTMDQFLKRAVDLAKAIDPHLTAPNPRVGCVVVNDGKIVSEGTHSLFGGAHAEAKALQDIQNTDEVYITLEPCDYFHGKKTPSCTEAIIKLKPKKVVVGSLDPKFQGKNLEKIKAAGIKVEFADCADCRALNPFLEKWHSDMDLPYVTLKIAQSLDGKITSNSKYITNEASRIKVHELRSQYSAVLTSTETIVQDDPLLDVRLCQGSNPKVVIVGTRALSLDQKVFNVPERDVFELRTHDLRQVLRTCKQEGMDSVLVEVGQQLNTEFLLEDLVDEIQIFIAPVLLGNNQKSSFREEINLEAFKLVNKQALAGDICLTYQRY